jgi:hypothetical protein
MNTSENNRERGDTFLRVSPGTERVTERHLIVEGRVGETTCFRRAWYTCQSAVIY